MPSYMGLIGTEGQEVYPYEGLQRLEVKAVTMFTITDSVPLWGVIICKHPTKRSSDDKLLAFKDVVDYIEAEDILKVSAT